MLIFMMREANGRIWIFVIIDKPTSLTDVQLEHIGEIESRAEWSLRLRIWVILGLAFSAWTPIITILTLFF